MLLLVCTLLVIGERGQASTVPFFDSFSYGEGTSLNGKRGWTATGDGSATASGGRANLQDVRLSNAFTPEENAVVLSFQLAPMFATTPSFPSGSRFKFYVNTNGIVTAYNGGTATNLMHTPLNEGSNVTFQVAVDYPMQSWSLSVGGVQVATNFALSAGNVSSRFEEIGFVELGTNSFTYVDNVTVQPAQTTNPYVLPFEEPFDALALGDLNGQRGWTASRADVQSAITRGGKACSITNRSGSIEHTFIGGHTSVWTKIQIRPLRGLAPAPPAGSTFAFSVNSNGVVVAYNGTSETELAGTSVPAGAWVTFATYSDYANTNWDLYLNERLIAEDFGFYSTNVTAFTAFGVSGGDVSPVAVLDNIYVGETRARIAGYLFFIR
jgi:hypothetical protein